MRSLDDLAERDFVGIDDSQALITGLAEQGFVCHRELATSRRIRVVCDLLAEELRALAAAVAWSRDGAAIYCTVSCSPNRSANNAEDR